MTVETLLFPLIVLGVLGALLAVGLTVASKLLYVEEDKRVEEINKMLPGYNCGACGYPGCGGFAEGIIEGDVKKLSDCKPAKDDHYTAIMEYLKENSPEIKVAK